MVQLGGNHCLYVMDKVGFDFDKCIQTNVVDDVILVSTEEAEAHAREAALNHGLLVRFACIRTPECGQSTSYCISESQALCFLSLGVFLVMQRFCAAF